MITNEERFGVLYDRFYGRVYGYCRRRLPIDRVEDAVADTFLTAWRRLEDVPEGEEALLWLYRVAYRVVGHAWRSSRRRRRLDNRLQALGVENQEPAEDVVIMSEEERQVLEAASQLRDKDEEILRLSIWEQLTNKEIASVLQISEGATKQRLHRARKNLTRQYNRLVNRRTKSSRAAQEGGAW